MGFSDFARHYFRNLFWFLFLRVLRCFSSPGSLLTPMYSVQDDDLSVTGFPHSDIAGFIRSFDSSPTLFAAYHVFLRLLLPRHPPFALITLTLYFPWSLTATITKNLGLNYLLSKILSLVAFRLIQCPFYFSKFLKITPTKGRGILHHWGNLSTKYLNFFKKKSLSQ